MNGDVIEAMQLIIEWYDRDKFCRERIEQGCDGCPYDLGKTCDSISTVYALEYAAKRFRNYLDGIK